MNDDSNTEETRLRDKTKKILLFILGFSFALTLISISSKLHELNHYDRRNEKATVRFPLVSPLLFCSTNESIENSIYSSFRFKVEHYVNNIMSNKKANHVSVYYRDLNNGPWFGINEDEGFTPSSLLKLPLLISALKENEEGDNIFINQTIKFEKKEFIGNQYFKPETELELGKTYTVAELLKRSIVYSDNESAILLYKILGDTKLIETYVNLGLISPQSGSDFNMNVKDYSSFFRVLYNSSYIGKESSEFALELLSESKFENGIRSGVPKDVIVSHKFGEQINKDSVLQLHDCGIVYATKKPYILCVMTRGDNFNELADIIKNISKIIYDGVVNEN